MSIIEEVSSLACRNKAGTHIGSLNQLSTFSSLLSLITIFELERNYHMISTKRRKKQINQPKSERLIL